MTTSSNRLPAKSLSIIRMCVIALVGLAIAQLVSGAQASAPSERNTGEDYTLRLNSNMVILSATVIDHHNSLVSGLSKDDFQIYEDGAPQQIRDFSHEDIPVTAGIVVDNSGSMTSKRSDVIAAALEFAQSSNPQDQMFVVNFNEHVSLALPPDTPFTGSRDQLQLALSKIQPMGQTALYDALALALNHLKQGNSDKKVLIVISDGGDNASKHTLAQVIAMAQRSSAIIYAIGIYDDQDPDQKPDVLKQFAKQTGGEAFFPESPKEIPAICEGIARDIRNQYTLTYVPTITSQDGSYRAIEVKASTRGRGRLLVRTRAGYSVSQSPPKVISSSGARP
jgi:VWFA-related protein